MTANLLTFNSSKTESLLIGLKKQLDKIHNSSLNTIHSARNNDFIFDEHQLRHVCTVSSHLPKPSEDSPLQPLLSSCQARGVIFSLRLFLLLLLFVNCVRPYLDSAQLAPRPPPPFTPNSITAILCTLQHIPKSQITRLAADDSDVSGLQCLLDLTVAFYTVERDLLMLRLERQFGHRGFVLQWFSSYLSDRTFQVVFGGSTSSVVINVCSVPQGSVLGPRLFILTRRTSLMWLWHMMLTFTHMQMTLSYICSVNAGT